MPVGGAMDARRRAIANRAVGNAADAAALEVTLAGPELRVEHAGVVAVAGADLSATLDGEPVPLADAGCAAGRERRCASARGVAARARTWRSTAASSAGDVIGR